MSGSQDPDTTPPRAGVNGEAAAEGGCLTEERIAEVVDGTLDAAERDHAVAHLAECARCRAAVADVARGVADESVGHEVVLVERPRRSSWRWGTLAVGATAAMLLLLVRPRPASEPPATGTHRATSITNGTAPSPMSPVGLVADAGRLRWAMVPGADRYRVTLFSTGGDVLYEVESSDTLVALPDSVRLVPRTRYLWKVDARTGFDRWTSSGLVEFSTTERPGR